MVGGRNLKFIFCLSLIFLYSRLQIVWYHQDQGGARLLDMPGYREVIKAGFTYINYKLYKTFINTVCVLT
jgi:hypothetical protein